MDGYTPSGRSSEDSVGSLSAAMRDWWYCAEKEAGLEHIPGLGWHGLRRKFADEHKEVPLKDLARLGGWKTEQTILTCYQDSDLSAMRRAQERRLELSDGTSAGN